MRNDGSMEKAILLLHSRQGMRVDAYESKSTISFKSLRSEIYFGLTCVKIFSETIAVQLHCELLANFCTTFSRFRIYALLPVPYRRHMRRAIVGLDILIIGKGMSQPAQSRNCLMNVHYQIFL